MPYYELAAFGAAICWSVTGLIAAGSVAALGPFAFNRLRWTVVFAILLLIVLLSGRIASVAQPGYWRIAASGILGVFLGDMMLFMTMVRLGPRRTGALFALNAPIAALLGWLFLAEELSLQASAGICLATAGIALAVLGRTGRSGQHRFEEVKGPVWIAVGMGVLAATGQATGSLMARPVMAQGFDPYVASMIRIGVAAVAQVAMMTLPVPFFRAKSKITPRIFVMTALSGIVAMVIGMTLLLFALQGGKVGIVSTLSALSPVLILPVLWVLTGARPSGTSWLGAVLAVIGMSLIFLR
ncbi:DMT family transporter [Paracoccus laeviglucosivorans]|uniref:Uncharacterized membrane protein n=1 Tax=Paracoccus laeviglucosivorans TaxID=1197861 RepID=A0A521F4H3_9RHOB|nr:DMT family transporter [Paracoccus laeviglucosivorans]SMO91054.1 Uncharacterized membrane protein [Paracoccus laeviglucosivorans]